jgi:type IV pilus assembly protein PilQ
VATRVFQPNYITADELQKLLTPMLSKNDFGVIAVSAAPEVGIGSNKDAAGGNSYAGGEVVLVRDFESVLRQMDEVFIEVDRMPSQVAIEAMIISVRLDDNDSLGVNFELLRNKEHLRLTSGPFGTTSSTDTTLPAGQIPATGLATLNFNDGLKIALLDESIFALIEALETIGDTNVIASPHVMCLNKQRAEILIGSELGYVSTTVTETAATQSVEFLEVGTHLKIRPFISSDGMVRLEVHPELSTGNVRVQGGFTLPDKDVTQVTTNIMCRSGGTVVIGGLIREDLVTSSTQIPVLGNLPLVGALFRQRSEDTERREIIVLLTPRVVGEHDMYAEADQAATQTRDRRNAFFDKMQPTNKRRIGERYHRLAISAWAAGDAQAALRYANLAIHYDPLLQGAIDLRQEVLSVYPDLESGVHEHLREGLRPLEVPHRDYSAETGWPWRELEPVHHTPGQYLPGDSGTSGRVHTLFTDRLHPEPQPATNEPRR